MYDKLGEMLNDALKSGEIPQNNKNQNNDRDISCEKAENSGHFNLTESEKKLSDEIIKQKNNSESDKNNEKSDEKQNINKSKNEKKHILTGQIIKMYKYTDNMHFPPLVQKSLDTLDIAYPFTIKSIQKQYRKLLKETHPDTKNTIQNSDNVYNFRHKTIDDIKEAYALLKDYFCIK